MLGSLEYIKQKYPNAKWSKPTYLSGTGSINVNYDKQGAKAIWRQYIYWRQPLVAGGISFLDQFGKIIFTVQTNVAVFSLIESWTEIPAVEEGTTLKVTCSNATVIFSIRFQYLM